MNQQDLDIIITKETSLEFLFDKWRRSELMKKFWTHRQREGMAEAENKVVNCQLVINKIYEEISRRAELLPIELIYSLIESGNTFRFKY